MAKLTKENRNTVGIIILLIFIAILFYVVYPPLRNAVGVYGFILALSLIIYTRPMFQKDLIGIGTKNIFTALLVGGGIGLGFYILSKIIPGLSFGIPFVPYSVDGNLRWTIICVFAPVAEEILCRGGLMGVLKWWQKAGGFTKTELWITIIVQALFFTALHATAYAAGWYEAPSWLGAFGALSAVSASLIAAFIFGIIFGYIVSLNGVKNLSASIIAHFLINNILFIAAVVYFG